MLQVWGYYLAPSSPPAVNLLAHIPLKNKWGIELLTSHCEGLTLIVRACSFFADLAVSYLGARSCFAHARKKNKVKVPMLVWMEIYSSGSIPRHFFWFSVSLQAPCSFKTSEGKLCMEVAANQLNFSNPIRSLCAANQNQQHEGKHTVIVTYVKWLKAMKSKKLYKLCQWTKGCNLITCV